MENDGLTARQVSKSREYLFKYKFKINMIENLSLTPERIEYIISTAECFWNTIKTREPPQSTCIMIHLDSRHNERTSLQHLSPTASLAVNQIQNRRTSPT